MACCRDPADALTPAGMASSRSTRCRTRRTRTRLLRDREQPGAGPARASARTTATRTASAPSATRWRWATNGRSSSASHCSSTCGRFPGRRSATLCSRSAGRCRHPRRHRTLASWDGRVDADSPAACMFELFRRRDVRPRGEGEGAERNGATVIGEYGLGGSGTTSSPTVASRISCGLDSRTAGRVVRRRGRRRLSAVLLNGRSEAAPRSRAGAGVLGVGPFAATAARTPAVRQAPLARPGVQPGARSPCGGDCNTVSQAGARPADPTDFTHNMCNLRTVFDLADLSKSRSSSAAGRAATRCRITTRTSCRCGARGRAIAIPWHQGEVIRATTGHAAAAAGVVVS